MVCMTDSGILARFQGSLTDGTNASIELTKYATTVDSSLLQVPAGAQIKRCQPTECNAGTYDEVTAAPAAAHVT
jgi:hypothetical protein